MHRYLAVLAAVLVLFACTKDVGYSTAGNFPPEVSTIFANSCAIPGCHTNQSRSVAGGVSLESWSSLFEGSDNGSPVIPYNAKFSPLMYFVNTYNDLGIRNLPTMPLNRSPLKHDQVEAIRNWINDGAKDAKGAIAWSGKRRKLYVTNQACDVVTVIDAESGLPMRYVEVGGKPESDAPHAVRVSPDGKFWYVIFINNNVIQKYSCVDDRYITDIPLTPKAAGLTSDPDQDADSWNSMEISPDGKRGYCVSWKESGKVSIVDLENHRFIRWIGGQNQSHGLALNAAADKIYITEQIGNKITVLDTGFTTSTQYILGPQNINPHFILRAANDHELYISCQNSNEVRVFDMNSNTVTRTYQTGIYPQEIVYSKIQQAYYVSCMVDSLMFPGHTGVITRIGVAGDVTHVACGYQPHGLAVDDNKGLLYVSSRNQGGGGIPNHHGSVCNGRNGYMNFIDLISYTVQTKRYELSVDPYFIDIMR